MLAISMRVVVALIFCLGLVRVRCSGNYRYGNFTIPPAEDQARQFKLENPKPIGLWTTTSGEPVEIRETLTLNSDQIVNANHLDLNTHLNAERVPERLVHAKGTAALGYFEVTHDVSKYTKAKVFNKIGNKTPLVVRFSQSIQNLGGSDVSREQKGMAVKFYTEEGNLDLLCLSVPVYLYKDPIHFPQVAHIFKRNPRTNLMDITLAWDFATLRPENLHLFFYVFSDYGIPNGYRKMDAFPIHTYEIYNEEGDKYYVRFNFRTEQGLEFLTTQQAQAIQATDLDYFTRDLYNNIAANNPPSWRLEMDVLTPEDLKHLSYDPFDVTRLWKNGTYFTKQIGRLVVNKNPDNQFRTGEKSAFNPSNLVPGIHGPVDILFKGRQLFYKDSHNYRLGANHNKIEVNLPLYAKTYVRDGVEPVKHNMKDIPNYYPNSFNGPIPFVDESKPKEQLLLLASNAVDFEPLAEFYKSTLGSEAHRQRFAQNVANSLTFVTPPVLERVIKLLYLIDTDLGKRVIVALELARIAVNSTTITG